MCDCASASQLCCCSHINLRDDSACWDGIGRVLQCSHACLQPTSANPAHKPCNHSTMQPCEPLSSTHIHTQCIVTLKPMQRTSMPHMHTRKWLSKFGHMKQCTKAQDKCHDPAMCNHACDTAHACMRHACEALQLHVQPSRNPITSFTSLLYSVQPDQLRGTRRRNRQDP